MEFGTRNGHVGAELLARVRTVCGERGGRRAWTLARLCDELGLVVDLQRASRSCPRVYRAVLDGRRLALALWLFELAVACACHGMRDFAPTLLGALPEVDGRALGRLLAETLDGGPEDDGRAVAVAGGAR